MLGGTREQVRLALQSCGYRLPERCVIAVGVGSEPQAEVVRPPRRRFPRDTSVRLVVEVGVGWYSQVFQRGLAVVQGNFVLAAVTPRDLEHRATPKMPGTQKVTPWWVRHFGEPPDLSQGIPALVLFRGRRSSVRLRPALILESPRPGGEPYRTVREVETR